MATGGRKNLGDILVEQGVINQEVLSHALRLQGRRLGEILIEEKLADPIHIVNALKSQAKAARTRKGARLSLEFTALESILHKLEDVEDQLLASGAEPQLRLALSSIRQRVEDTLLGSVGALFQRIQWMVSQISRELGREIELVLEGEELSVDRTLIDELSEIALHLVRNALDHGIEPREQRLALGKKASGLLRVSVATSQGGLSLTVSDDGQGVDEDKIYAKAISRGLLSKKREEVTRQELHQLLFTPGFSTADTVSSLSGRGIGLDVVEAGLLRMGGEVRIWSEKGKGTTFMVAVPLSYSRLSVLPLRAGVHWIALAQTEIAKIEPYSQEAQYQGMRRARELFAPVPGKAETRATSRQAPSPPFIVHTTSGSLWGFDELGTSETALVHTSLTAPAPKGVVGAVRLSSGKVVLFMELGRLSQVPSN